MSAGIGGIKHGDVISRLNVCRKAINSSLRPFWTHVDDLEN
jgi:hypothetical protein